jgi:hypothetical protein
MFQRFVKYQKSLSGGYSPVQEESWMPTEHHADRDHDLLLRFVERFALELTNLGMARMPARVFAYVLADDAERYTAAELADALRVSPAAISGAVRTLGAGARRPGGHLPDL